MIVDCSSESSFELVTIFYSRRSGSYFKEAMTCFLSSSTCCATKQKSKVRCYSVIPLFRIPLFSTFITISA